MKYSISYEKDDKYRAYIHHKIKTFNNAFSPYHKKSRKDGLNTYFDIRLEDETLGGMCGLIYWNMMEIEDFYIEESLRNQGIGGTLMDEAINMAKESGLNFIILRTFSFQAKEFFEKFGFKVIGEITDYPPGESYYTMRLDTKE